MADAPALIETLREGLRPVEDEIRQHPYLAALEAGRVRREDLRRFAGEQSHIIRSDLRSIGHLASRFAAPPSAPFFQAVLAGEHAALDALRVFARAVGMDEALLDAYEPAPGAQAYPAFMAWLALHGSEAEVAGAFLVNFAAWGANCGRMSRALQRRYGFAAAEAAFFDLFASPPADFDAQALAVVDAGLAHGTDPRLVMRAARMLQGYERQYWDTLHALSGL